MTDLNSLMAEKVMGWELSKFGLDDGWRNEEGSIVIWSCDWTPTIDIGQAMKCWWAAQYRWADHSFFLAIKTAVNVTRTILTSKRLVIINETSATATTDSLARVICETLAEFLEKSEE